MTLHISNLSKRYGNNWVLRDVSLDVEKGSVLGILGPAESGKSTLLRILAGREKPTPDNDALATGGRSVTLIADLGRSGIWPFKRSESGSRSASEILDRSLADANDILLIDDPLLRADHEIRESYLDQIKAAAAAKQLTVIYATSDFETAARVSDQIAVLANSYIHQSDTAEELYESPVSTVVARLTGRCNIIPARRLTSTKFDIPEFQTLDGGHRLFAEKADISKLGAINRDVSLAIRPENISMSFGASFPEDNLVKAVVTKTRFLGPVTLVELDASGLRLNALVFRLVGLDVGQECMLGLPPDRIKILRD
jgi:ABC-type Fe3+/spermidine/putrescine transport system ATPase subunit